LLGETFGDIYGITRNGLLLLSIPLGVVTVTKPLVAGAGTVAVISVSETTINVALAPLKLTAVDPVRLLPRIMTWPPVARDVGTVSTNGGGPLKP
jgi:hypothetical protein